MSEAREERLAKNEVLFRALNENIQGIASTLGRGAPFEFICECATSGCFERLTLTLEEYERVRLDGTHFLVAAGHEPSRIARWIASAASSAAGAASKTAKSSSARQSTSWPPARLIAARISLRTPFRSFG